MPSLLGDSVFSMILAAILPVVALGALFWAFRLTRQNNHLITAMDNMSQGLCMFDGSAKLVVANKRYREIYKLPAERTQPGCSLRDLLAVRRDTGTFDGDPDKYVTTALAEISAGKPFNKVIELKTGMVVALATRPMRGGGWVVTHEDISMCGYGPAVAMLTAARQLGARSAELVKYATSGDVSGDRNMVVGYAGVIVR